ncbi:Methyltransferase domain-containing protein (fragment) [uncultured Defluviicoccus sp.]|uniref:Methyltransferase domain-containing protein n=1 Tax=metagenome TaxID=256318 RepID=A0A380TKE2_9ZZZZ
MPALIEHNVQTFGRRGVQFLCVDIAAEELPQADLCLIRQVFQHLSNDQIKAVIKKLGCFNFTLVTEHYPSANAFRAANLDKVHGADVRLYDGSAVLLDHPPFNVSNLRLVLEEAVLSPVVAEGEVLRTFLIEGSPLVK